MAKRWSVLRKRRSPQAIKIAQDVAWTMNFFGIAYGKAARLRKFIAMPVRIVKAIKQGGK